LNELTGLWSSCFMLLFVIAATALVWMHVSIRRTQRREETALPSSIIAAE